MKVENIPLLVDIGIAL